ncbi:MAG TPA: DUF6314 family protein, partial [Acidothermaceae bacterium]
MHAVADLAAYLLGRWSIEREIVDAHHTGFFRGNAEFTGDDGVVDWIEAGQLQWAGETHQAGRRLLLAVRPDSLSVADVAFDDGRFFHRLDLSRGCDTFVHGCAPDTYIGSWAVDDSDQFTIRWTIEGP